MKASSSVMRAPERVEYVANVMNWGFRKCARRCRNEMLNGNGGADFPRDLVPNERVGLV